MILFQLEVFVYDEFYPKDKGSTIVTVRVNRNPNIPYYIEGRTYSIDIDEKHPYGSLVIDLNATDSDGVSIIVTQSIWIDTPEQTV